MNKFNSKAKCPKCGNKDLGTSYHDTNARDCHYDDPCYLKAMVKDHIVRNCRTCSYEWLEACLDSKDEKTLRRVAPFTMDLSVSPPRKKKGLKGSSFACVHANEVPAQCDCESDCYCQINTCQKR